jgi:hypothetical protein
MSYIKMKIKGRKLTADEQLELTLEIINAKPGTYTRTLTKTLEQN